MRSKTKALECECEYECGGWTKGGRFLPGHDAKLKKELIALARSGKKRARNRLEKLGGGSFCWKCKKSIDGDDLLRDNARSRRTD